MPAEQRGGYEYWLAANLLEFTSDAYDTLLYDTDGKPVQLPGYRVDALTDAAIRYVDSHQAEPFFLFVSYLEPHIQNHLDDYPAPDGYREQYTGRWMPPDLATLGGSSPQHLGGYYGMVKRLDEALGRLLDALRSLNLLENTVVLFTSDHGCHFKTRNAEYKRSCHESSIRVPTALCGPGFDGGGQIDALVSLVDLPPTLLDAAGLPIPPAMQGRSILGLLRGDRRHLAGGGLRPDQRVPGRPRHPHAALEVLRQRAGPQRLGAGRARTTTSRRCSTTWRPTPTSWRTSPGSTPSAPSPTTCANASSPAWSPPAKPPPRSRTPPSAQAASVPPPSPRCASATTTRRRRGDKVIVMRTPTCASPALQATHHAHVPLHNDD